MKTKNWIRFGLAVLVLTIGCSGNDLTKSASPVALIVSNTQILQHVDITGGTNCEKDLGTILMQAIAKNATGSTGSTVPPVGPTPNTTFNQVRVFRYQVSYARTDGGKLVPAPYVRSMDTLLTVGGSASGSKFILMAPDGFLQAPFAALFPNNGGRDPDTGKAFVQMDIIVEIFGQTLAGENVSGSTRFPVDFCYNCGGCS